MTHARSLLIAGLLAVIATSAVARPPAEILADLEALPAPIFDTTRRGDPDYVAKFNAAQTVHNRAKQALILELYEEAPGHEKIPTLMPERWRLLHSAGHFETALDEASAIIDQPLAADALRTDAAYWAARLTAASTNNDLDESLLAIERFMQRAPEDDRAASLLIDAARAIDAPDIQLRLYDRALALFPDSPANTYTDGKIRQIEEINQPFNLNFSDIVTGADISLQRDLRGKVVVITFWAASCDTCVADLPELKRLYDEYAPQGAEFIGISHDAPENEGGLDELLACLEDNNIRWPQYYQGARRTFSTAWGVDTIPTIFVIDAQGRLHSTNARGKLPEILPDLLSQRGSG